MASGRVGGTRSKIRGLVGDIIYQVVKNPDGTYTQISYGKPEDVTQTITPRLQAQRMCTSMVEALMRDLKPIATISMQSAANKSKSLNAFSSYNVQLVARDCKANWYGNNQFFYPRTYNLGTESEQLGGRYMLSSGTWQYNGFDELVFSDTPYRIYSHVSLLGKWFAGARFDVRFGSETFGQWLRRHYMSALDTICLAVFHDWYDWEQDPDDPTYFTRHSYVLAHINTNIPAETIMTRELMASVFQIESDWDCAQFIADNGHDYYIGVAVDNANDDAKIYFYGGFTISYLEGKKKISSSSMITGLDYYDEYISDNNPSNVMGTWMGTPSVRPYPSPFV